MKSYQIYFKTIGFCFLRILFYFLSVLATVVIVMTFFAISERTGKEFIGTIGNIISFIAFTFLIGFAKKNYNSAHIAEMTDGIVLGNISNHPIKDGKAKMNARYTTLSPLQLFIKSVTLIYMKIKKQNTGKGLIPEIKSFIVFTFSLAIPFLGPCCVSWTFSHDDEDIIECYLKGLGAFFHNFKNMIGTVLLSFFIDILLVGGLALVTLFGIVSSIEGNSVLIDTIVQNTSLNVLAGTLLFAFIAIYLFIYQFINPIFTINVLRKYQRVTKENPGSGTLIEKITGFKDRLVSAIKPS